MLKKFQKYRWCVLILVSLVMVSCGKGSGFTLDRSDIKSELNDCTLHLKKKKYEKAIKCFESYKSTHYGQASSALAELAIADAYFAKKEYLLAAEAYKTFARSHSYHAKAPYAYFQMGLCYIQETPKSIDRDQTYIDNAINAFDQVVSYYPQSNYAAIAQVNYDQARLKKAKLNFYVGRYYFRSKEYLASIPRFQTVVTEYSNLGLDEKSFYYLIKALQKTRQKELASKYYDVFQKHFPESRYIKRIKL